MQPANEEAHGSPKASGVREHPRIFEPTSWALDLTDFGRELCIEIFAALSFSSHFHTRESSDATPKKALSGAWWTFGETLVIAS